jgi:Ser/Thr protein kinase RdoA (MazF antagonist)
MSDRSNKANKSMLQTNQLHQVIRNAWQAYDPSRSIEVIKDISALVSTNRVYKVGFSDKSFVIAKLSHFGKHEHFVEDHSIINVLANNLPAPYDNLLSRSLMKANNLFVHRFIHEGTDVWVVFYRPIPIRKRLPRRLDEAEIAKLAVEFARFHRSCHNIRYTLPSSSKTMQTDIDHLLGELENSQRPGWSDDARKTEIKRQCQLFRENSEQLEMARFDRIPVFVDWNIGNFSVSSSLKLFSRWDYDWFRMSTRMLDFYFLSRVVSDRGDRTVFTYDIGPLNEDRFIHFLKAYHAVYPLTVNEIKALREVYRFFLLHYVIHFGEHFFAEAYAKKLQDDVFAMHFPLIESGFSAEKLLLELDLL